MTLNGTLAAFSPDGDLLATSSTGGTKIWEDGGNGQFVPVLYIPDSAQSLAFAPDGHRLAVATNDYTVKLLDVT